MISGVVGMVGLGFVVIGWMLPSGKLIVIEALAVIQIAYFSIFQFNKIPPTYIGLKNLIFSNGYNDLSLLISQQNNLLNGNIFTIMGINY